MNLDIHSVAAGCLDLNLRHASSKPLTFPTSDILQLEIMLKQSNNSVCPVARHQWHGQQNRKRSMRPEAHVLWRMNRTGPGQLQL